MPLSQLPTRTRNRIIAATVLRVLVITVGLLAVYFLAPIRLEGGWGVLLRLAIGLAAVVGLLGGEIWLITHAQYPQVRAAEALAITVPVFVLLFARLYVSLATSSPANFTAPMDRVAGIYFTVTVLTTVGFGDIAARTDLTRIVVTAQMILGLGLLGLLGRLLISAATRGLSRAPRGTDAPDVDEGIGSPAAGAGEPD